ncbi:terminase large subunit [Tardiphaga alba]|uniref:Terminase large subunit n=2 Tax=Tardiphaga alba TaxID=340268 RepID=A0ABX8AF79_9BRAD|nr:terminase large subunit [Tardiphaga alba]
MLTPAWIDDGSEIPDPFGRGQQAVEWLRKLKHPKNPAPGHPFEMGPWQERIFRKIYGPRYTEDVFDDGIRVARAGSRIVRRVVLVLPRGNRKTSLAAAINMLHIRGPEREPGNLVISAATSHEQAVELFEETALIIDCDKRMRNIRIRRGNNFGITFERDGCRYKPVASDGKTQHGKTPKVIIADELHAWEGKAGREQWNALTSALVKVPETLLVIATTSGRGQDNLAWEEVQRAIKIQKGEIVDPSVLPVVFMAEKDDDWQDERLWRAVNPGMQYGYPDLGSYRVEAQKAVDSPSERHKFLQYNLNVWQDRSTSPFVEMSVWDEGARPIPADMEGAPCWIGVDMSTSNDLTAVVACIPHGDDFVLLPFFFCPEADIAKKSKEDGVDYPAWAQKGFITATPGDTIDYTAVIACITALCDRFDVQEINFDPALAGPVMQPLTDEGLPTAKLGQNWQIQTPALRDLERIILNRNVVHAGHPVLRWNFANVAVHHWGNANRAFRKDKSTGRIDGAVATWMAVSRAAAPQRESVYDREDFVERFAGV